LDEQQISTCLTLAKNLMTKFELLLQELNEIVHLFNEFFPWIVYGFFFLPFFSSFIFFFFKKNKKSD